MKQTLFGEEVYMYLVLLLIMGVMGVGIYFILEFKTRQAEKRDFIKSHYDTVILLLKAKLNRAKSSKAKSKLMVAIDEQQFQKNYYMDYPHEFDSKFKITQK